MQSLVKVIDDAILEQAGNVNDSEIRDDVNTTTPARQHRRTRGYGSKDGDNLHKCIIEVPIGYPA
jgi:hypothetical protein